MSSTHHHHNNKNDPSPLPPTGAPRIWLPPSTAALPTVILCRAVLVACGAVAWTCSEYHSTAAAVALLAVGILYGSQGPRWSLWYRLTGIGLACAPKLFYRQTYIQPGYEPVADAFADTLREGRETSVQFAVYVKGELVVDLAGSLVQPTGRQRYINYDKEEAQLQFDSHHYSTVWSCSKVVTSIVMAWLVDQGHLDYHAKIVDYWPEFTGGGKEDVTVEQLLKHNAGLHTLQGARLNLEDLFPEHLASGRASKIFEGLTCWFPPQWSNWMLYHGMTRGWLLNEIARRVDPQHRTLGVILREEFTQPLGISDEFFLGLPAELCDPATNPRLREMDPVPSILWVVWNKICQYLMIIPCTVYWKFFLAHTALITHTTLHWKAVEMFVNPKRLSKHDFAQQPAYRRAESPAANVQATARALATIANAMATRDPRIFKPDPKDPLYHKLSAHEETRYLMPMPPRLFSGGNMIPLANVTFNDGGFCVMDCANHKTHIPTVPGAPYSWGWFGFNGSILAFHPHGDFALCFQPTCFNDLDPVARLERMTRAMMACGRRIHGASFGQDPTTTATTSN